MRRERIEGCYLLGTLGTPISILFAERRFHMLYEFNNDYEIRKLSFLCDRMGFVLDIQLPLSIFHPHSVQKQSGYKSFKLKKTHIDFRLTYECPCPD